jgi:hypothetical protein
MAELVREIVTVTDHIKGWNYLLEHLTAVGTDGIGGLR